MREMKGKMKMEFHTTVLKLYIKWSAGLDCVSEPVYITLNMCSVEAVL